MEGQHREVDLDDDSVAATTAFDASEDDGLRFEVHETSPEHHRERVEDEDEDRSERYEECDDGNNHKLFDNDEVSDADEHVTFKLQKIVETDDT